MNHGWLDGGELVEEAIAPAFHHATSCTQIIGPRQKYYPVPKRTVLEKCSDEADMELSLREA